MAVSIVVSIFLSRHLFKVARATASVALEANARNISADIYSALAVLVAMVVVRLTGYSVVDPIVAIGVAIYLLRIAFNTVRRPLSGLIDAKLPHSQEMAVKTCLAKHSQYVLGYHALRTRRSGSQRYIDLHLVMNKDVSLQQAHDVCDMIEMEIDSSLPGTNVTIHVEPTGVE
jgi:cation diffusion facilitator family transporter